MQQGEKYIENIKILKDAKDLKPIIKKDIDLYEKDQAFVLYNVLSKSECDYYIKKSEQLGYNSLDKIYRKDYRNNDRLILDSIELSELIFERIKPFIGKIELDKNNNNRVGVGHNLEGTWEPIGLNERWRLCRYKRDGHFGPHYDGNFIRNHLERSMKTFMIYLNNDYNGGSTNFLNEKQNLEKDKNTGLFQADQKNILLEIKSEPGMAIIFNHQILHEGGQLLDGQKYIMRSDIMFKKINNLEVTDPKEILALEFLEEAIKLEYDGKNLEAVEKYSKAFKLCPKLENIY